MNTIRNPMEWTADAASATSRHLGAIGRAIRGEADSHAEIVTRPLDLADLREALARGVDDFLACRSDVIFLSLFYPLIGLAAVMLAFHQALAPMLFPAVSGLALVGPATAVGLYEMSRRREAGLPARWSDALGLIGAPGFGAMLVLGLGLFALFVLWLGVANAIYLATLGANDHQSMGAFFADVIGARAGWTMTVVGCGVGFLFAVVALVVSIVSFPLLLDRRVGVIRAVQTSLQVSRESPVAVAAWGLIVAVGLLLGSLPVFLGLIFVVPILGHATWALYRRAVV